MEWLVILGMVGLLAIGQSWHCLAMCGPLVLQATHPSRTSLKSQWVYHIGRITAYLTLAGLGLLAGHSLVSWHALQQQQWILGLALMVWFAIQWVFPSSQKRQESVLWRQVSPFIRSLQKQGRHFQSSAPVLAKGILGFSHGLIPCGLVYQVLLLALVGLSPTKVLIVMVYFGLMTSSFLWIAQRFAYQIGPKATWPWVRHLHWAALMILCLRMVAMPLYQRWEKKSSPQNTHAEAGLCHSPALRLK